MRTITVVVAVFFGLSGLSVGSAVAPHGVAAAANSDAGAAIVTVDSHCEIHAVDEHLGASASTRLDCAAIFRNGSDRPVFDVRVKVRAGGRPVVTPGTTTNDCCDRGTRRALAPGGSALWLALVQLPDGVESDASVTFDYSAAWVGDAVELDAPTPQLQYIDRVQRGGDVGYIGEVGNTDGRSWSANEEWVGDGELRWRAPAIAFFQRGRLSGAEYASWRAPGGGIAADGRYLFGVDDPRPSGGADSVQAFFRDEFAPASSSAAAAASGAPITPAWELIGLDHQLVPPAAGRQRMTFRVSVRNKVSYPHRGSLHVIARRADFHALGIGRCELSADVAPGATASCSGVVDVPLQRGDASVADVRFVTVELGGDVGTALGEPAAPVAPVPELPCPPPAITRPSEPPEPPRLSLPTVVGRVCLPWATLAMPAHCP